MTCVQLLCADIRYPLCHGLLLSTIVASPHDDAHDFDRVRTVVGTWTETSLYCWQTKPGT